MMGKFFRMKKVFVADDDFSYLFRLNVMLARKGCYVRTFSHSQSLFDAMEETLPDVVMLNKNLDGESGKAICKEIKSRYNNSVSVILASDNSFAFKSKNHCADVVLNKPFDSEEVSNLFNKIILQ